VLSLDDRFLCVSWWGTGERPQCDVSDPFAPVLAGSARLGGIVSRFPHRASGPLNGGPQMVELGRDGGRLYLTNSLYASWDAHFYPEGIDGWAVELGADPAGGLRVDPASSPTSRASGPTRCALEGGDASSAS
jgi:selenium-binding protein 1